MAALTALIFYIYAVLGINIFGSLNNHQSDLNRHASFANFGQAMLTLLRVATGEDWAVLMYQAPIPHHPAPSRTIHNPMPNNSQPHPVRYTLFHPV